MYKDQNFKYVPEGSVDFPIHDIEAIGEIVKDFVDAGKEDLILEALRANGVRLDCDDSASREMFRMGLSKILVADSARLEAECICLAAGFFREKKREGHTRIALRYGIEKQSVHKRVKRIMRELGIKSNDRSKSLSASKTYALCNFRPDKKEIIQKAPKTSKNKKSK